MPPKPARLNSSHFWASSFAGSALVMRQTFSSLRPSAWRSSRAACAASGKQTCSGQTAWVRIERLTLPLFFSYWKVRYSAGVGFQGGKIRLGGGEQFLDVLVKLLLVVFNGEQIIPSAFQHDIASGLGLGVQGVQGDQPTLQVQVRKELLGHGDFIGLGVNHGAAQVILAGHTDGGEHALTAAMFGLFAIHRDELVLGRRATQLLLNLQQNLLEFRPADFLQHTPKGRLARGRVTPLPFANAQSTPLPLAQLTREFGQIL